jgi:tRNA G26 N,N-dimethylase Trm1
MAILTDFSMKDFREMEKREQEYRKQWERNRIIKRCRECGKAYSYEKGEIDPKACQECRGDLGDLIR